MKTEGRPAKVWVYISQAKGLGTTNFSNCDVTIEGDRVEIMLDAPQVFRGVKARHFSFPSPLVAIAWA